MIRFDNRFKPIKNIAETKKLVSGSSFQKIEQKKTFEQEFKAVRTSIKRTPQQQLDAVYEQAKDMEVEFTKMMVSSLKKNIHKSGLIDGGRTEEIFTDMLNDEYSKQLCKTSNLGLADIIYRQITGLNR